MSQTYKFRDITGRVHDLSASGGGGDASAWSTFPAISDIDAAGYKLSDNGGANYLLLDDGGNVTLSSDNDINLMGGSLVLVSDSPIYNAATTSHLDLGSGLTTFGLNNGEPAGVGADINLVSANGGVLFDSAPLTFNANSELLINDGIGGMTDLARITVNDAFTLQGVASADAAYFAQNMYFDGASDLPINYERVASRFLIINLSGYVDDANGGIFNWQTWTGGAGPITWTSLMQLTPDGVLRVGANADDGSVALIQSAGDISAAGGYWAQAAQGTTDTIPNTFNNIVVTGGIITSWN